MVEEDLIFNVAEPSHDHLYFGNLVYGGMMIDKIMTKTRDDGLIERRLVFAPSDELIRGYNLKSEVDGTPQGFIILWVPENWIIHDTNTDATFGRRTIVLCDYRLESTKLLQLFQGKMDPYWIRRCQNAETKLITQQKKELMEYRNPDASFDNNLRKFKSVADILAGGRSEKLQQLPPEV